MANNDYDTSERISASKTKYVQSVVGSFLYYSRAIDGTMLTALNEISTEQANPTQSTLDKCQRLLDYAATYPDVFVRFYASDMILNINTDATYLVQRAAKSRIAGYYYMGTYRNKSTSTHMPNGAILIECKTLKHVVASAAEAETAGVFHNAQCAIPIRYMLDAIGHPQPATPIKTDNSTAQGFVYDNINQKRSKSWDMRYYWLRDKQTHQQFDIYWERGTDNHADYYTKHHPTKYHKEIRNRYVQDRINAIYSLLDNARNLYIPPGARVC